MTSPDQPAPFQLFWQLDFKGGSTHVAYQVISYMISQSKETARSAMNVPFACSCRAGHKHVLAS